MVHVQPAAELSAPVFCALPGPLPLKAVTFASASSDIWCAEVSGQPSDFGVAPLTFSPMNGRLVLPGIVLGGSDVVPEIADAERLLPAWN